MNPQESAVLARDLRETVPVIDAATGIYYHTREGQRIIDGCGGSAVACLGYQNPRVQNAITAQMERVPYCHSQFFTTAASEDLATAIIATTENKMAKFLALSSGSEAMEVAMKLARQYFLELPVPQPQRTKFISRQPSYHGATLSTLSLGGHLSRRAPFEPLLSPGHGKVSQCNAYRGMVSGECVEDYVSRLAAELDHEFGKTPPGTVCAFVAETITGASTGCVVPVPGYWPAIEAVCRRHGALLILDEIMCGMGRTGTMHAWQQEGVVPNIQAVGKSLGGGYVPVSGVLIDHEISQTLRAGSGVLSHGQSFQAHPVACAAALAVQRVISDEHLLDNVTKMGHLLGRALETRLGSHPHVGNIRGRGLFWAVEFVSDKVAKRTFPPARNVGPSICKFAAQPPYNISVYPGKGTADGIYGDHVLLAPAYVVNAEEIELIVNALAGAIFQFFSGENI
ncbi:class III aminotransferase like protein [Zymoseptoria brevis]|uniref:Class III aminotransferase like protein n=1 Tax=Zymoseptoria brevis TaxID=1047168 RepID=A0A0F4GHS0_9PEZI|nr:class III aminotransferase like protein [Zymoseptoria brevis]